MGEGIAMGGKQGRKKRNWLPLQLAAAMPLATLALALRAWGGRRLCAVFAAGEPAVLRRTLRGSTAGPAAAGRCGAARRSARGRAPEKALLCINRKRINAGELANMQNTACGEYADNEYNIWWNMQMSH